MPSHPKDLSQAPLSASIPEELAALLTDTDWEISTTGRSSASTYRVRTMVGWSYLKIAPFVEGEPALHSLEREAQRLKWLATRAPVPDLQYFGKDAEREYLLTSEIVGLPAHSTLLASNPITLVKTLAGGLRLLHAIDIANCPFDERLDTKLATARRNLEHGLVDETDFDKSRMGRTASSLFIELLELAPSSEDLVFTHGDYSLPNVILSEDAVALHGFIDMGNAGIADRYQDLALARRSIVYNFGGEWVDLFFEQYGLASADQSRLDFYQLLDEFF